MDENKPVKKKRNLILRLLAFLVTLVLVAAAVFLIFNWDKLNIDALKRYFAYRTLELSDSGQAESFPYAGSSDDVFYALGDDLLICSKTSVRLYSGGGVCYVEDSVNLESPAAEVNGELAAVYSVGGSTVYLYRDRALFDTVSFDDNSILSLRLNSAGWMAVTTQDSDYKAIVSVYDASVNKRMDFRFSTAFVADAAVTDDCSALTTVSVGMDGTAFESTLSFYNIPDGQESGVDYSLTPSSTHSLGNNVILAVQENNSIWSVGDCAVSVWDGEIVSSFDYSEKYLKDYTFSKNFAAVLIGKYRYSSQSELYTVDEYGTASVGRAINDQVLSLSAAGKYVAVLTADRLDIFTEDLELYSSLKGTDGARNVIMREDGTALLISSETAHLFVPN